MSKCCFSDVTMLYTLYILYLLIVQTWLHRGAVIRPLVKSAYHFLISQPKHVVGTQKNSLNETVLLSAKHTLELMGKEIFTTLR